MNKGALWNKIKVGAQVDVDDASLLLKDRLSHSAYRLMCCPFRSVSIGPRLEIRFKDRLQDELERSLDHAVTDGRNRKDADLVAPVFRNLFLPYP